MKSSQVTLTSPCFGLSKCEYKCVSIHLFYVYFQFAWIKNWSVEMQEILRKVKILLKSFYTCLRWKSWCIDNKKYEWINPDVREACDLNVSQASTQETKISDLWGDCKAPQTEIIYSLISIAVFTWFSIVWGLTGTLLMMSSCCALFCNWRITTTNFLSWWADS